MSQVELLDLLGDEGILNLPLLERLQQLDQQPGFEELTVDREALRTFSSDSRGNESSRAGVF